MSTSNKKSNKKKKSGGSPMPIILFILIAGGVAASNFVGPAKGWMTSKKGDDSGEVAKTPSDSQEKTEENNSSAENKTSEESGKKETSSTEKAEVKNETKADAKKPMTEFEKKHKEFFDEFMAKKEEAKKLPTVGRRYPVVTINGDVRDGILDKVDEYSIHLSKIKPYNAKSSIHYSRLRKDMAMYFFPEKAANTYANKMLEKYLQERNVIAAIEEETAPPATDGSKTESTAKRMYSSSLKEYDTSVAESSPRLAHAAMEVNNYLRNQDRITKKRDGFSFADVEKGHAKQHGSSAVFYMYVTPAFAKQSTEYKFQVVDGIRRFWALRCMSNGVAGDSKAFLCIVNGSKVVGGSKLSSAEDIFVK